MCLLDPTGCCTESINCIMDAVGGRSKFSQLSPTQAMKLVYHAAGLPVMRHTPLGEALVPYHLMRMRESGRGALRVFLPSGDVTCSGSEELDILVARGGISAPKTPNGLCSADATLARDYAKQALIVPDPRKHASPLPGSLLRKRRVRFMLDELAVCCRQITDPLQIDQEEPPQHTSPSRKRCVRFVFDDLPVYSRQIRDPLRQDRDIICAEEPEEPPTWFTRRTRLGNSPQYGSGFDTDGEPYSDQ